MAPSFEKTTSVDASVEELFDWHTRPGALTRLLPPFEGARIEGEDRGPVAGERVELEVPVGPIGTRWVARIERVERPTGFVDVQESGPFASWRHEHRFEHAASGAVMRDHIEYELPVASVSRPIVGGFVERKLERGFRYRHDTVVADLAMHREHRALAGDRFPRRVLVAGASGLVGEGLCAMLSTGGHEVVRLVRRDARGDDEIAWDPAHHVLDPARVAGFDAVVCLSGAGIADGRWTDERKELLRSSRLDSIDTLARALLASGAPPRVLVQASAVGFYDDSGERPLDESAPRGRGFLPELCEAWEDASRPLEEAGVRVARMRLGVVLTPSGGALAKMLPAFRLGVGGRVGDGRQWLTWVAYDDVLAAFHRALCDERLAGPVVVAAPEPIQQRDFARTLGRVLHRPAIAPLPGPVVGALFGEMGRTLLLRGPRAVPGRLMEGGFRHRHPDLEGALRHLLGTGPVRW
ncbi:MAG: TIGR01777 family oxidoreductase [Planctomycetota bacterium]